MRGRVVPVLVLLLVPATAVLADPGSLGLLCDGALCNFEATTTNGPANETYIAVDPQDPDHIVAVGKDYTLGSGNYCGVTRVWLGWYTSFDGGKTWTNGLAAGGPNGPLAGYGCVSDPVVAFGGDGSVYISGLPYNGPGGSRGVIVFQSLDGGLTFPISGWAVQSNHLHDKNWLAVDPATNRVYVTWTDFNVGIMATAAWGGPLSAASGKLEFLPPVCIGCGGMPQQLAVVNNLLGITLNGQGTSIAIGADSTVYVTWLMGDQVILSISPALGFAWLPPAPVFSVQPTSWYSGAPFRTPTLPAVAVDRTTPLGKVYFSWQDRRRDVSDVMIASSDTRGLTWSDPVRINTDAPGRGQYFPSVCVAPGGKVYVGWVDRRLDGYSIDFFGSSSTDGGATWSPNERLSTVSSDPKWSKHQEGFTFIGDYTGTACAGDGTAWSVWADTRKGVADAMVAHWT